MRHFLHSEIGNGEPGSAFFHVLPAPLEATVSYGAGTARGPEAILAASGELELFLDPDLGSPGERGVWTSDDLCAPGDSPEGALPRIQEAVGAALKGGSFPLLLGGEHTVSVGAFAALAESGRDVGVVQVDAHADLREEYEGSRWSHACVMRRAVELGLPVFQVGVRAMCREEHEFRRQARIPHLDGKTALKRGVHGPMLPKDFPREVWLTFDVDGLDPSLMPATGTPVPGGLDWRLAMAVLDRIGLEDRRLLGADVVELAPITGLHHPDFTAARLCYEIMGRAG